MRAAFCVSGDHRVEGLVEVTGQAFAGGVVDKEGLEQAVGGHFLDPGAEGVGGAEDAGVVKVLVDPVLEVMELAEVDDEAVGVDPVGREGDPDGPVVSMDEGAAAGVKGLAVTEGDVPVCLGAGEHGGSYWVNFQWLATISSMEGASGW